MDEFDVTDKIIWNGVRHGTDGELAAVFVLEGSKFCVEHLIGLLYGDTEAKPVASRRKGLCCDIMFVEPRIDSIHGVRRRANKIFNLQQQVGTEVHTPLNIVTLPLLL